jgi:multidrug efflux system outer membrane protein
MAMPSSLRRAAPLLALLLAACAVNTPSRHDASAGAGPLPAILPTDAAATAVPGLAIDRWWTLFGDPALDALVEQTLRHNHDLAAAAARVQEARAQLDAVRGAALPSLDLQVQHARGRQPAYAVPPGVDRTSSQHTASLAARYELDLWGRLASGSEAARQRLLAQEWARAALQWSLTAQTAEAHVSLRALQRQVEIGEAVRTSRAQTLDLRRREHGAGATSEFELRRAQAEFAASDASLAALRRQRLALESTLALLSGRPLDATAAGMTAAPLDVAAPFELRLPAGDAAAYIVRRPDLRQAEARLEAARADIAAARAATLPAVRLSGAIGSDAQSLSKLFDGPGFAWSIAAAATQSLIDGGQARARVAEADARADAALADYRQAVLGAVIDVREAYAALAINEQSLRATQERVDALEHAHRLAQRGVAAGAIGRLDLLDAEPNAYHARLDAVSAARDRLVGQIDAFRALGGGLPAEPHAAR